MLGFLCAATGGEEDKVSYLEALSRYGIESRKEMSKAKGFSQPRICHLAFFAFPSSPLVAFVACSPLCSLCFSSNHHSKVSNLMQLAIGTIISPTASSFPPPMKSLERMRRSCGPEREGGRGVREDALSPHLLTH